MMTAFTLLILLIAVLKELQAFKTPNHPTTVRDRILSMSPMNSPTVTTTPLTPSAVKEQQLLRQQIYSVTGRNLKANVKGNSICYDFLRSKTSNRYPPIIYLPGLLKEKSDLKSINLQSLCKKEDFTFLSADYLGVGRSGGSFSDATISKWTDDIIYLIDTLLQPIKIKPIFVGHALGAWITFLIAKKRPDLVGGIVGISSDPDFTEELLWKTLSPEIKERIMNEGEHEITWGNERYPITRNLIEDGRKNLILNGEKGSFKLKCAVRLLHAMYDEEVPYSFALRLTEICSTDDIALSLVKSASHEMDGEEEIKLMRSMIFDLMTVFREGEYDLTSPASG